MGHATTASDAALAAMLHEWLERLGREWSRARRGDREGIHRLRTASRRLRELLPVAGAVAPARDVDRARRDVKRAARTLATVRDLDVTLALLADEPRADWDLNAVAAVARDVAAERERRQRPVAARLDRLNAHRIAEHGATVVDDIATAGARARSWERTLAARLTRRAVRLARETRHAGTLYAPEALHRVRIACKKLRYGLEIAHDAARVPVQRLITTLTASQEALGTAHDLHVLEQRVRALAARRGSRALASALREMAIALDRECRQWHAAFLGDRAALLAVCDVTRREVAPSLGRRKLPMIKISSAVRRAARRAATA